MVNEKCYISNFSEEMLEKKWNKIIEVIRHYLPEFEGVGVIFSIIYNDESFL